MQVLVEASLLDNPRQHVKVGLVEGVTLGHEPVAKHVCHTTFLFAEHLRCSFHKIKLYLKIMLLYKLLFDNPVNHNCTSQYSYK